MSSHLVVGMGLSGAAAAQLLRRRGHEVVVVDDAPGPDTRSRAEALGARFVARPGPDVLDALVAGAELVVVSPGVAPGHRVFTAASAHGVDVRSEIELAALAIGAPLVAVTGTNGKTTVTVLVAEMLRASGLRAEAAGNVGLPLTALVDGDHDVVVVEVSSFQLALSPSFRPSVAVWLNLGEDHLDWHPDMDAYAAAKARIWANQGPSDIAVANAADPVVMRWARRARGGVVTFAAAADHRGADHRGADHRGADHRGADHRGADYRVDRGVLRAGSGEEIVPVAALALGRPHDLANALAASAAAISAGATIQAVRTALIDFKGLPHRLSLVGDAGGVRWYDDSKATNPHAVLSAVSSFDSVVLVAGGRNKGLDLSALAGAAPRLRAVVAMGEAAPALEAAFEGSVTVSVATSMDEAVNEAAGMARPGDVVLLSPGCASFDRYRSYAERGDDFARAVRDHLAPSAPVHQRSGG